MRVTIAQCVCLCAWVIIHKKAMQLFSVKDFAHRVRINIIFCSTSQHIKRQRLNGMSIRGAHVLQLLNYYFIYRMPFKWLTSYFFFRLNFTLSHLMDSQPNNKPNNCYGNHVDVDGGKKNHQWSHFIGKYLKGSVWILFVFLSRNRNLLFVCLFNFLVLFTFNALNK